MARRRVRPQRKRRAPSARERARELGIPYTESERSEAYASIALRPSKRKPPPAISLSVLDVARAFGDVKAAVEFARQNRIPPSEWADEVADEFDVDIHALYDDYYDTDPARQAAA